MIDTATDRVVGTPIPVGLDPYGVAVTPDGAKVYVVNLADSTVSMIDTSTDRVVGMPIPVGSLPHGVAVAPDGTRVYVTNSDIHNSTVSVIDTATNRIVGTPIPVGNSPVGVAVTPDGTKVFVAKEGSSTVAVIATATNTVIATIPIGNVPRAFGKFIGGKVVLSRHLWHSRSRAVIRNANLNTHRVPIRGRYKLSS